jgi:hypothetical protein
MVCDEVQDVLLTDPVEVVPFPVPVPILALCALRTIPQPTILDLLRNLALDLPKAQFKVALRVAVSDTPGSAHPSQFVDDGTLRATQSLGDSCRGHARDEFLKKIHLAGGPRSTIHVQCRFQSYGFMFEIPALQASQPNHLVEHLEATIQPAKIVRSKLSVIFCPPLILRFGTPLMLFRAL